jgi:DNA primase
VRRAAAELFQSILWSDAGAPARDYLAGRTLTRQTLKQVGAGAAVGRRNALTATLAPRFGMKLLERAGLVHGNAERASHDRFRNRVILPVQDEKARVVGFGARSIDQTPPKYPTRALPASTRRAG